MEDPNIDPMYRYNRLVVTQTTIARQKWPILLQRVFQGDDLVIVLTAAMRKEWGMDPKYTEVHYEVLKELLNEYNYKNLEGKVKYKAKMLANQVITIEMVPCSWIVYA